MNVTRNPLPLFFRAPEHGGDPVMGRGHRTDEIPPAGMPIAGNLDPDLDGGDQIADFGVPGSKGFPLGKLREDIERRAREIWEEEGRPEGRAAEHWLRAEAEIGQRSS